MHGENRMIELFRTAGHPYYVWAPDYRDTSSGVRVLHLLCHALNSIGEEAYITAAVTSPALRTPTLDRGVVERHEATGRRPIAVYPEVVSGNPLGAGAVVRYLLNRPGFLGGDRHFDSAEFVVAYKQEFVIPGVMPQMRLFIPPEDPMIFHAPVHSEAPRAGAYYYASRYLSAGYALSEVTKGAEPLTYTNPRSLLELAELFRSAAKLYCYETTALALEARLCGCPVVFVPSPYLEKVPDQELFGVAGAAWGDSAEEVAHATATVGAVSMQYEALRLAFWDELRAFVTRTQEVAEQRQASGGRTSIALPEISVEASGDSRVAKVRVAVFSLDEPEHACAQLRVLQAAEHDPGVDLRWSVDQSDGLVAIRWQDAEWADVIVVQRFFPSAGTKAGIDWLLSLGKPIVYETDDLLEADVPDTHPQHAVIRQHARFIAWVVANADAVTVSTEALRRHYSQYSQVVEVVPNGVDVRRLRPLSPRLREVRQPIRVGYAGTLTHQADLDRVVPALRRLIDRFGETLELEFFGCAPPGFDGLACVRVHEFQDYQGYLDTLRERAWDIGFAPLADTPFNRCKSPIKWIEYSVLGMAGVFSDIEPYRAVIDQHRDGILVGDDEDSWFEALADLIENPQRRVRIATAAQAKALADHSSEVARQQLIALYSALAKKGRTKDRPVPLTGEMQAAYAEWCRRHALKESDAQYMAERMMLEWRSRPVFHLLVLHEPGCEQALADTLDSLAGQLYRGWGLSIVSAERPPKEIEEVSNLEWLTVGEALLEAGNAIVRQTAADWMLLLEPGVRLAPEALFSLADYAEKFRSWQVIYADEDRIGPDGERRSPLFKPDFNLDLVRSAAYMGPLVAFRRDLLAKIGGYRYSGEAATYDAVFRALESVGETAIGHVAKVLFHRPDLPGSLPGDEDSALMRVAVEEHLQRLGIGARVGPGFLPGTHVVDYEIERAPRVSVIVPTRDQSALLQACVDSMLARTSYPDFEVLIIDNGSTEAAALAYMQEVALRDPRVRVLRYDRPYSFSAINNFAAAHAQGELLLLLNNDTEVLHDDWMTHLASHACRPEVGAVGARLVHPDGTIQHAGVVLGMTGTADHPEAGAPMDDAGYMGRLQVVQNWSAVTAACLMVRKELYDAVGGLDEEDFNVLFNDVDFCLKLAKDGYKNVWTPYATLVHHASVSLKASADFAAAERACRERVALQEKWGRSLAADPAFNRNLSLASQATCIETGVDASWDPHFRERPRVMAFPLDAEGTGHYRVWGPLGGLDRAALVQYSLLPAHGWNSQTKRVPTVPELLRAEPDTLLIQHGYLDLFLDWIGRYRAHTPTFLVFGQDDNILNVPERNSLKKRLIGDLDQRVAKAMGLCDRLIVTTEPLVEVYRKYIGDIRVVPNCLDGTRWAGVVSKRKAGRKPRVGWAGALQHLGDLEWLEPVVKALASEVEWVFMGMCPKNLRPHVREFHQAVAFDRYPEKLASLDLDLALAPLELHPFNEAKSDLRILEYGILGWPVIATDIYPYQGRPVTCIPNDPARWIGAIRERVNDQTALAVEGDRLREWVLTHRMLENNLDTWVRALFSDEVLREFGVIRSLAA